MGSIPVRVIKPDGALVHLWFHLLYIIPLIRRPTSRFAPSPLRCRVWSASLSLSVVASAVFAFLKYSTTGKQIRAVSQNAHWCRGRGHQRQENLHPDLWSGRCSGRYRRFSADPVLHHLSHPGASFGFRALIVVVVGGLVSSSRRILRRYFAWACRGISALFISPSFSDMIVFVTFIIILVVRQVMILRRR